MKKVFRFKAFFANNFKEVLNQMMSSVESSSQTLCALCSMPSSDCPYISPYVCVIKESMGAFSCLPNEVIVLILQNLSIDELSLLSITNKWFRDFIVEYFFESKTGFQSLLNEYCFAINIRTKEEQKKRIEIFKRLGLK